jgi:hypothetical protein
VAQTNLDGRLELEQDGLADEDLSRLGAQPANLLLEQEDLLSGTASTDFQQSFYDGFEVHIVVRHAGQLAGGREEGGKARVRDDGLDAGRAQNRRRRGGGKGGMSFYCRSAPFGNVAGLGRLQSCTF